MNKKKVSTQMTKIMNINDDPARKKNFDVTLPSPKAMRQSKTRGMSDNTPSNHTKSRHIKQMNDIQNSLRNYLIMEPESPIFNEFRQSDKNSTNNVIAQDTMISYDILANLAEIEKQSKKKSVVLKDNNKVAQIQQVRNIINNQQQQNTRQKTLYGQFPSFKKEMNSLLSPLQKTSQNFSPRNINFPGIQRNFKQPQRTKISNDGVVSPKMMTTSPKMKITPRVKQNTKMSSLNQSRNFNSSQNSKPGLFFQTPQISHKKVPIQLNADLIHAQRSPDLRLSCDYYQRNSLLTPFSGKKKGLKKIPGPDIFDYRTSISAMNKLQEIGMIEKQPNFKNKGYSNIQSVALGSANRQIEKKKNNNYDFSPYVSLYKKGHSKRKELSFFTSDFTHTILKSQINNRPDKTTKKTKLMHYPKLSETQQNSKVTNIIKIDTFYKNKENYPKSSQDQTGVASSLKFQSSKEIDFEICVQNLDHLQTKKNSSQSNNILKQPIEKIELKLTEPNENETKNSLQIQKSEPDQPGQITPSVMNLFAQKPINSMDTNAHVETDSDGLSDDPSSDNQQ